MAEIQVIIETPLALFELKEKLSDIKKRDKELSFRGKKAEDYLNSVVKTKEKKLNELKEQLTKLEISRLKPSQIIKIVDVLPKDSDSLKIIFSGESTTTLKQEDMARILDTVKKYA